MERMLILFSLLSPTRYLSNLYSLSACALSLTSQKCPAPPLSTPALVIRAAIATTEALNASTTRFGGGGWIARNQTEGFSDSQQKSFKSWDDLIAWWTTRCTQEHGQQCPAFEQLTFSLTPPAYAPPPGPGCTRAAPAASASTSTPPAYSSNAPAPSTSSTAAPAPTAAVPASTPAYARHDSAAPRSSPPSSPGAMESSHGGYGGLTAASFQWAARHTEAQCASTSIAPPATPTAVPSPFNTTRVAKTEPVSPKPHKEEPLHLSVPRVTPSTRVQLTPVGCAHADTLARRNLSPTLTTRRNLSPSRSPASTILGMPAHARAPAMPSILSTPAGPLATAPPPSPEPATHVRMYGVRGVGVFYDSYASARAAATRLGLEDSKIMVTDNVEKLESWITGKPFVGEEW